MDVEAQDGDAVIVTGFDTGTPAYSRKYLKVQGVCQPSDFNWKRLEQQ